MILKLVRSLKKDSKVEIHSESKFIGQTDLTPEILAKFKGRRFMYIKGVLRKRGLTVRKVIRDRNW